jgi:hypothetical protein
MGGPGSGGANRISAEQHKLRGTYRRGRHAPRSQPAAAAFDPVPEAPTDLAEPGLNLWAELHTRYVFGPGELRLVVEACRVEDRLARLAAIVASEGVMYERDKDGMVAHPALREARLQQATLASLLRQLRAPDAVAARSFGVIA